MSLGTGALLTRGDRAACLNLLQAQTRSARQPNTPTEQAMNIHFDDVAIAVLIFVFSVAAPLMLLGSLLAA